MAVLSPPVLNMQTDHQRRALITDEVDPAVVGGLPKDVPVTVFRVRSRDSLPTGELVALSATDMLGMVSLSRRGASPG